MIVHTFQDLQAGQECWCIDILDRCEFRLYRRVTFFGLDRKRGYRRIHHFLSHKVVNLRPRSTRVLYTFRVLTMHLQFQFDGIGTARKGKVIGNSIWNGEIPFDAVFTADGTFVQN